MTKKIVLKSNSSLWSVVLSLFGCYLGVVGIMMFLIVCIWTWRFLSWVFL